VRDDHESCAFVPPGVQVNGCLSEKWASQYIDVVSGADGVEPKSAHNVPGRHLAHAVIATNPIDLCVIGLLENTTNPFLRKPRLTGIHKQIGDMMHGFVGMVIVRVPAEIVGCFFEQSFQCTSLRLGRRLGEHRRWSQSGHKTVAPSTR
jgi:hypothetical protein